MSKNNLAFHKFDADLKKFMGSAFSFDLIRRLNAYESDLGAPEHGRSLSTVDMKHAGHPPIESLLHEPWSGTLQEMVGRGDDYESAATKMIKTALLILEINERLRERRVALLASAASDRDGYRG
jgi:hypothetical protein